MPNFAELGHIKIELNFDRSAALCYSSAISANPANEQLLGEKKQKFHRV